MRAGARGLHSELFDRWLTTTRVGGLAASRHWPPLSLATTQPKRQFNSNAGWYPIADLKISLFRIIEKFSVPTFRFL